MLESAAGISTLLFIAMGGFVGIRLLLLAKRTKGLPEALLGLSMLLIVGVGYTLYIVPPLLQLTPSAVSVCSAAGILSMSTGWAACWLFTWRVFRPNDRVAMTVSVAAIGVVGLSGAIQAVDIATSDRIRVASADLSWTTIRICALSVYLWCGFESGRYWWMLKKRLKLGLADPVVTNRFLLWAIVMGVSFANVVVPALAAAIGAPDESPGMRVWIATTGLVCAGALYLGFLPPQRYTDRIRQA